MSLTLDVKSKNQLSERESLELRSEGWTTDRSGSQQTKSPKLWESVNPPELQGTSTCKGRRLGEERKEPEKEALKQQLQKLEENQESVVKQAKRHHGGGGSSITPHHGGGPTMEVAHLTHLV